MAEGWHKHGRRHLEGTLLRSAPVYTRYEEYHIWQENSGKDLGNHSHIRGHLFLPALAGLVSCGCHYDEIHTEYAG